MESLKYGGRKDDAVQGANSRTPWCCMGAAAFHEATKNPFGGQGWRLQLVVHGQRHNYGTVEKHREWERLGPDKDWRQVFLDAAHGRFMSWEGTFDIKANTTEVRGFFIPEDKLDAVARVSDSRPHKRR